MGHKISADYRARIQQDIAARQARWTREITRLMVVVMCAAVLLISLGVALRMWSLQDTAPAYALLAFFIPVWWASRHHTWPWVGYLPALLCFGMGALGSALGGYNTSGVLFYLLSVILASMMRTSRIGFIFAGLGVLAHIILSTLASNFAPFETGYMTVFAFLMLGVALLHWFYENQFRQSLEAEMWINISLHAEAERRLETERALEEQETQLRRLAEHTTDLVAEVRADGTIIYASPSHQTLLGYDPQTLIGKTSASLLHPDDLAPVAAAAAQAVAQNQRLRLAARVRCADGGYLDVELSGKPLYDYASEHTGFIISSRDITDRLQAEATAHESETRFRRIIELLPLGMHIYHLQEDGKLILRGCNPAADRILGIRHAERLGLSIEDAFPGLALGEIPERYREVAELGVTWSQNQVFYQDEKLTGAYEVHAFQIGPGKMAALFSDITGRLLSESELRATHTKLEQAYSATLAGWARALELRERETANHSQRVVMQTVEMAQALGVQGEALDAIRRGALLHDIGKVGVPDSILLKPGPLTADEWVSMRQHVEFGYDMLREVEYLRTSMDIPYCHHERWDGAGYPRGLQGEEIPLAARIFAVVDVYDALTHARAYRPAWSAAEARRYLRKMSGKHFDPQMVDLFLKLFNE